MSNDAAREAEQDTAAASAEAPVIEVVSGSPTDEELAALVAVISASATTPAAPAAEPEGSGWAAYWRRVRGRGTPPRAVDAWRRSFR